MSEDLNRKVAALEADVHNLTHGMDRLTSAVQKLSDKISHQSKTDWSVIAAWSAVMISVLGSLGYLALHPVRYDLAKMESRFYNHELNGGHQEMKIKVTVLKERVEAIENEQRRRTDRVYKK